MKRISLLITVLLLTSLACNFGANIPPAPDSPAQPTAVSPAEEASQPAPMPPADGNPPPAGVGLCDNIYLPVIPGATWTYALTGPVPDTYIHSIVSVGDSSFVEQDVFGSGVTRMGEWSCADGNLTALDPTGGGASVNTQGVTTDFKTTSNTGITFPANPKVGDSWSQTVTMEGTQTVAGNSMPAKSKVTVTCTVTATESVSVAAGAFEALRVECVNHMDLELTVSGNTITATLDTTGTNWYAPNVGLVKQVLKGDNLDSSVELTSYSLPNP